jgi:hypothetical protein
MLARDAWPAFASLVLISLVVYVASWTGWFLSDAHHAYNRDWAQDHPGPWFVPSALVSLWHYHVDSWQFRKPHGLPPYRSNPWGWLVLARPVSSSTAARTSEDGCRRPVLAGGRRSERRPSGGRRALPARAGLPVGRTPRLARRRDPGRRGRGIPAWFPFAFRTIFSFYAVAFVPFLVLA